MNKRLTWNSSSNFFSIQLVILKKVMFLSPTIGCAVTERLGIGRNPTHTLSLGGGGIFKTRVPTNSFTSTLSLSSVLDTPEPNTE